MVVVSWGDGKYGQSFYGAYIYLGDYIDGKVEVKARVNIGRRTYFTWSALDLGTIGIADNDIAAVRLWGHIKWTPEGIEIGGDDGVKYFIKQDYFEAH